MFLFLIDLNMRGLKRWSCRLVPTCGLSYIKSIFYLFNRDLSPMPLSWRILGDSTVPADIIISFEQY